MQQDSLIQRLKALADPAPLEKMESIRRAYLFRPYLLYLSDTEIQECDVAINKILQKSFTLNIPPMTLFAEGLEGKCELPKYLNERKDILEVALRYFAWGDPSVEELFPEETLERAKTQALTQMREELEGLLKVKS